MAFDPVPWFVGGGAEHSPEVARMVAYTAFRGNEGIMGPGDLSVQALAVPGTKVRVLPGACAILSRAVGGAYQAYGGRAPSETQVDIAATGSSGGRSDLIVARVEDPFMPGEPWQTPADPKAGPYIFPRVIAGVPAGTKSVAALNLGYSAIALARIDLPANTGTVTQAMIVDLRKVANPRRERTVSTTNPNQTYSLTATTYSGPWTNAAFSIDVPTWATKAIVRATVGGVVVNSGTAFGAMRTRLGSATTQGTRWDCVAFGDGNRTIFRDVDTVTVPSSLRGTTQTVTLEAFKTSGPSVYVDTSASLDIDIEFVEAAA